MSAVKRVCLIGFGEVGAILAEDLLKNSELTLAIWDKLFPIEHSLPNQRFARLGAARAHKAATAIDAASSSELVISAVTADQDIAAANSVLPGLNSQAWFLDLNSVSPGTKCEVNNLVDATGARYIEAAVMAPISPKRIATPILLAGPNAQEFVPVAQQLGFSGMSFLSDEQGKAAASKMCRSVIIKGMEALVSEALLAARHYGVESEVLNSLNNLFPHDDWPAKAHYLISRTIEHGERRAEEMREVAKTVQEAGITPWMSEACAERQQWASELPMSINELELIGMLDAIKENLQHMQTD